MMIQKPKAMIMTGHFLEEHWQMYLNYLGDCELTPDDAKAVLETLFSGLQSPDEYDDDDDENPYGSVESEKQEIAKLKKAMLGKDF